MTYSRNPLLPSFEAAMNIEVTECFKRLNLRTHRDFFLSIAM